MKNVFNQVKNNLWKRKCQGLAVFPLYRNHPINMLCKSMGWFLCNGNTESMWWFLCNGNTESMGWFYVMATMVWIEVWSGWMAKVNANLYIFLASSSKRNIKLRLGRWVHTAFQTGRMQSFCYLAPKKKIICNELVWHFGY